MSIDNCKHERTVTTVCNRLKEAIHTCQTCGNIETNSLTSFAGTDTLAIVPKETSSKPVREMTVNLP